MRLPGVTGYKFNGEPVRITWSLRSRSPNCASRPANQRSDSTGQMSEVASFTAPTTDLVDSDAKAVRERSPGRSNASPLPARTNPACMPLLAINH